jgi:hypothetical protein
LMRWAAVGARCSGWGQIGAAPSVSVRLWRRLFAAGIGSPRVRLDRPRPADLCDGWKAEGVHVGLVRVDALDAR